MMGLTKGLKYWGYIGIVEKNMETGILGFGLGA